jgi:hypothetical protein
MKLSDPDSRRQLPGRITQEFQDLKLWKLEYPIIHGRPQQEYDGLCLTIWCALLTSQRPAGAERVAQILGPAIAAWARDGHLNPADVKHADRFIHARDNDARTDLTPEDQLILAGMRWEPGDGSTLEA